MAFNKERLKVLRVQDELSQAALAQALGVSRSTISMYESGQREPDFEMLEAMADYFNVPIASLFTDNKSPAPTMHRIYTHIAQEDVDHYKTAMERWYKQSARKNGNKKRQ